jgi:hypothetical protein
VSSCFGSIFQFTSCIFSALWHQTIPLDL